LGLKAKRVKSQQEGRHTIRDTCDWKAPVFSIKTASLRTELAKKEKDKGRASSPRADLPGHDRF